MSTSPGRTKKAMPTSPNSPLVKRGPKWQVLQLPRTEEEFQPALRGQRIARRGGAVAGDQRVAESVERACAA